MRKLFLTSYRIQNLTALEELVGKTAAKMKVAILPNSKDYLAKRAWDFKNNELLKYLKDRGFENVTTVDLKEFDDPAELKTELSKNDLIWGNGGNTFCLRYEMRRSGLEDIIGELLDSGIVYGGESAGAIVAGTSLKGIESADEPGFAPKVILDGLNLVDHIILPHTDNVSLSEAIAEHREAHKGNSKVIELKDSQAVAFRGDQFKLLESE